MFDAKCCVNHFINVILKHPLEGGVEVGVDSLDVGEDYGFVEQHLVEVHREPSVNVVAVEHRNTLIYLESFERVRYL